MAIEGIGDEWAVEGMGTVCEKNWADNLDWECVLYHREVFDILLFDVFAYCALFLFVV